MELGGVRVVGLLSMAVALNFAEAGSRFDGTGGPYLYTRAAFGRFFSFEVGWMTWFVRVSSWASVVNVLADALGFYWPEFRGGGLRGGLISFVILSIMALNLRGHQAELAGVEPADDRQADAARHLHRPRPAAHFVRRRSASRACRRLAGISAAALPMIFAFGGYEVIPVPAGEARNPKKAVPFAMIMTIIVVGIVMTLAQIVALGTLPNLAASGTKTPLADAALLFIGGWGALMMTVGASISVAGNNVGAALSGSRSLFALAEQGDIPRVFGHIHARFRTPDVAIITTSLVTLALALARIVRQARTRERARAPDRLHGHVRIGAGAAEAGPRAVHDSRWPAGAGHRAAGLRGDSVRRDAGAVACGRATRWRLAPCST